ncbi:unnamed protein product [Darwinula stevensoni]|nr:unnamed protein product [Darwinula stevensoni]CAG0890527.1 unnamed protein product [Darwinula stevensoni]
MDIPKRPRWSYSMSKDEVEIREARYFKQSVFLLTMAASDEVGDLNWSFDDLLINSDDEEPVPDDDDVPAAQSLVVPVQYDSDDDSEYEEEDPDKGEEEETWEYVQRLEATFGSDQLANMELNLETWRQLWRVLEMSNVVLVIADIRFTALMFPPSLYHFVKEELGKHLIFVLHKIDLVPPPLVLAWKKYLQTRFPGDGGKNRPRGRLKWKMATKCASKLCEACETLIPGIDFSQWKAKILEDEAFCLGGPGKDSSEDASDCEVENILEEDSNISPMDVPGVLTIGCVGFPNVGKSSLINALMGFKVVSVSRTPGHTKHFQTIYLTNNVRLCDCPGLVFPSSAARHLQVLMGSYPIAQLQEPYSAVQFLAEALPIVKMLRLVHPDHEGNAPYNPDRYEWCAWDVCDAWAEKRGYRTKKAARLDTYRAANHILRLALEGKICLCLYPPGYNKSKSEFETSPELQEIHSCYPPSFFSSLEVSAHTNKSKEEAESDISDDEDEGGDETTGGSVGDDDDDDEEDDEPGSFNKFAFLSEQSV